jgi:hypothetical protein
MFVLKNDNDNFSNTTRTICMLMQEYFVLELESIDNSQRECSAQWKPIIQWVLLEATHEGVF